MYMMRISFLLIIIAITAANANAQTADIDSTFSYMAGEGLTIRLGKTNAHKINVLTTVQSGLQINKMDSVNSSRLSLNLVRFAINASLLKDKVFLGLSTDFSGISPILEGWIGFSVLNKHGMISLGQKQTDTNNRLAMADERYAQNIGQTISGKANDGVVYGGLMQNFVGATREGGLFIETGFNLGKVKICPSASVTTGEGQNFFDNQDNSGFKYGGRLDILPFGYFTKNNAFISEDIYREQQLKLVLGFAGSYNVKASSPIGSDHNMITGIYNDKGKPALADYGKINADFMLKYKGYALIGEYINASVQGKNFFSNTAASEQITPEKSAAFYNLGNAYNVQTSYVTNNSWSVGGRYTLINPEFNSPSSLVQKQSWYTFTINRYIKNNALKAGINITYISEDNDEKNKKSWLGNIGVQLSL